MPENNLVNIEGMPVVEMTEDEFKVAVSSSDYLPRLQVTDSNSKICKKKLVEAGNYAIVRSEDEVIDLSNQIDILLIHMMWKALDTNGDTPTVNHDKESDEYQRIVDASKVSNSGCMWGPEFLVWVPSAKTFATFFCCSATSRREAKNIFKLLKKAATLKTHFIEKGNYSWWGPLVFECSTPFELPDAEEIKNQAIKFANPEPPSVVGDAPEAARER